MVRGRSCRGARGSWDRGRGKRWKLIVRELGMSKKTFYRHFENQEEPVRSVVLGNFEELEQRGLAIFDSERTLAQ
jgi:AraC-like DNA-binding protein